MKIQRKIILTPLGEMVVCATEKGICLLEFSDKKNLEREFLQISKALQSEIYDEENWIFPILEKELSEYFDGKRTEFSVPIFMIGTDFQKSVWEILKKIPYGTTLSYKKQAEILGNPNAVRAVANANGQNKIAILIPCHRVIGTNGTLTGYAGGLWRKEKLLGIEKMK